MAKIVFIQDVLFDFHGIECLSAMLKKHGHEVDVYILPAEKEDYIAYLRKMKPDLVGFSISSTDHEWSLPIAKRIKKELHLITIFGGPHPTYFPESINTPFVDIICIGEGEYALLELMDTLDVHGDITKIQNLYVKKNGSIFRNDVRLLMNLDELPMPDRGLYFKYSFLRNTSTKRITPSRGCPYNCSYCYNQKYRQLYKNKGTYVRYRKVESIIDEIVFIKNNARLSYISFVADTFTTHKKWLKELMEEYDRHVHIPFFCQAQANEVNEEIIQVLKKAGCNYFSFGVESGNERIRKEILNKNISDDQILFVAQLLHKYNIPFCTFNMFGFPEETIKEAFDTLLLNVRIKADTVSATILQPTIGTHIYEYIKKNNLFVDGYDETTIAGHYEESPLKLKDKKEIINLQRIFYLGVKFPWLIPIIRKAIKLPQNFFFKLILKLTLFIRYKKTRNYSLLEIAKIGWHLRKYV